MYLFKTFCGWNNTKAFLFPNTLSFPSKKASTTTINASSKYKFKDAIELSDSAGKRLNYLLTKRSAGSTTTSDASIANLLGIRLGVKKRGCNGLSYTLDYAVEKKATDEVVKQHGVTVFIDPQALMKVVGTKMDYIEDPLRSEFVFINPNAKTKCPCGESFNT